MRLGYFFNCNLSHKIHFENVLALICSWLVFTKNYLPASKTSLVAKSSDFHLALTYFCFQLLAPRLSLLGEQDFPNGAFPFLSPDASNVGQHTVVISLPG